MNNFMKLAKGAFSKTCFKIRKHGPEILIIAGAIGTVASAVMACQATLKVNDILDESKEQLDKIHKCAADSELSKTYSKDDMKKDTAIVYIRTGMKFVKLYGPSVALGALSLGSMLASNNILRKRNVALAAAYATVDQGFKEYRNRVIERFGNDIDKQLKYNLKAVEIEEQATDEDGNTQIIKKTVQAINPNGYSEYARLFDAGNPYWEKDADYNLMFLRARQSYFNDKLKIDGRVFLNDVYKQLGFPTTKAGQVVGWVYDPDNPVGDNYIDFGIYDVYKPNGCDLVNGYERSIWLDFNVDGNIWEMM